MEIPVFQKQKQGFYKFKANLVSNKQSTNERTEGRKGSRGGIKNNQKTKVENVKTGVKLASYSQ